MIDLLVAAILSGLAGYRLAAFLVSEKGPFDVFLKIREKLGIEHSDDGLPEVWPNTFLAQLLVCNRCASVWTVSLMVLFCIVGLEVVVAILAACAVAAIVGDITGG